MNPENDYLEVYPRGGDPGNGWDWRRCDQTNGQIVATSGGQGYASPEAAEEAAMTLNAPEGLPIFRLDE